MDKNKNCSACDKKIDKDNKKKNRTVCKNSYNEKKRKTNDNTLIQNQQPKIDNVNNNNNIRSTLLVGPSFSGKTNLMLKIPSRIPDRYIYIYYHQITTRTVIKF